MEEEAVVDCGAGGSRGEGAIVGFVSGVGRAEELPSRTVGEERAIV